jgi:hypothetical protein
MTEMSFNSMPTSEWCPGGFTMVPGDLMCAKTDNEGTCINWVQNQREVCKTGQSGGSMLFSGAEQLAKKAVKAMQTSESFKNMRGGAEVTVSTNEDDSDALGAVGLAILLFDALIFFVFLFAIFYTIYLIVKCNDTFIGFLYELMVGVLFPFYYIPYAHFVKSCQFEFIWSWITSKIGNFWGQVLAVITSFGGTFLMFAPIIIFFVTIFGMLFAANCDCEEQNQEQTQ